MHSFEKYVAEKPKFTKIAFYQIARPSDDPRKPKDYTSLDSFWTKQGYAKHPEHTFTLSWKEIGDRQETIEPMVYWIKDHSNPSQA